MTRFLRTAIGSAFLSVPFLFLAASLSASVSPADVHRTNLLSLEITQDEYEALRKMEIEFVTGRTDTLTFALVSDAELQVLQERQYDYDIVMESETEVELYKRALYGPSMSLHPIYHTSDEILRKLNTVSDQYPDLTELRTIGRTTQGKREIRAIKISDHADQDEDEPVVMFSGGIHADELPGIEICMTLIDSLTAGYGKVPRISEWVDSFEIWIIPVINVDGHHVVTDNIDPRWRKNTRDLNNNGVLYEYEGDGIDLNRNFNFNWAHGGSSDSTNQRYRGPHPFSEGAARAVRDLALEHQFLTSITYHSQGEVIFYPWVWGDQKAPDDKLLTEMANELGARITTMDGDTTYIPHYGAGRVGQTYPWLYGRVGTFDFIVETGKNRHIFPPNALKNIVASNIPGAFYLLGKSLEGPGLTGHVVNKQTGAPLKAEIFLPDIDNEMITTRTSEPDYGRFYRLLKPGTYRVIARKEGYRPKLYESVRVGESGWTELSIQLEPISD